MNWKMVGTRYPSIPKLTFLTSTRYPWVHTFFIWPVPGTHRYPKNFFLLVAGTQRYPTSDISSVPCTKLLEILMGTSRYQGTGHVDPWYLGWFPWAGFFNGCIFVRSKIWPFSWFRTFEFIFVSFMSRDKTYYLCSKIFRYFQYFIHEFQKAQVKCLKFSYIQWENAHVENLLEHAPRWWYPGVSSIASLKCSEKFSLNIKLPAVSALFFT